MKYIFSVLFVFALLVSNIGCSKNNGPCTPKSPQSEKAAIEAYASANGITATAHSSGLYYQIITPGTGATPTGSSKIYIKYTGKLTDGTIFDSQSSSALTGWILNGLIEGWQIGLPLIKKGGYIKLIIPSAYGYGCTGSGRIPADAILYFEIELVDVQ